MRNKLKIICTLALLAMFGNVMAEASPSAVEGISATAVGNEVTAIWDTVTSDPIAYYRIYYSAESILENDGLFDDFETTEGDETTLTFIAPRGLDQLYIAVIAVSDNGLESEFFIEEARVDIRRESNNVPDSIPTTSVPPVMEPQEPLPTPADIHTPVRLLKADVLSPTTIVTTFSAPLTVDKEHAPEGLKIENAQEEQLQIKSITIERETITIITVPQTRGAVYNVQFSEPFEGRSGQPLDATDRSALVTGHSDGEEPPVVAPVRVVDPIAPPDVTNAQLVSQIQQNSGYTVTVEWTVDNAPEDLHGIVVYQTRDGQTFGPPSLLPIDIGGVQLQGVTPGFFGLYIQTMNIYGYVSPGIFQYANLPPFIPEYEFQGNLTFDSMDAEGHVFFDEDDEPVEETDGIVTIEVISKDTPLHEIKGVDHSAAAEEFAGVHWQNASVLAGGTSIVVLMIISSFVFIPSRHKRSLAV